MSGLSVVCIATSGGDTINIGIALAQNGSGLRLPAVGIIISGNIGANQGTEIITNGYIRDTVGFSSAWSVSGQAGRPLYVGSGGRVVLQSDLISGNAWQRIGTAISGGMLVNISPVVTSGGLVTSVGTF